MGFVLSLKSGIFNPNITSMKDASNLNIGAIRRQSILANFTNTNTDLIEVPISKSLFDELSNDIEKAKYLKRLGSPGNYTYIYAEPKGKSKKKEGEKEQLSPAAQKHKQAMDEGATEEEADQIARGKRNVGDHSGKKQEKEDEEKDKNPTADSKTDYSAPGIWRVEVTNSAGEKVYSAAFDQKRGDKKNALERGHS